MFCIRMICDVTLVRVLKPHYYEIRQLNVRESKGIPTNRSLIFHATLVAG